MQRHTEALEAKLVRQAEFTETEEIFVEVLGKVTADELLAAVVEGANAICSCVVAECRSLICMSNGRN